ncbi:DUF4089 domain-containing protein [Salipiger sp.]|uniref:DUF4089 domain-containing protein n=1 Tax=Salipiger sp. TaxID=2078585 RepID=UPI003A96C27C
MDLARYMEAASELMDLPVAAEWRPGTLRFLGLAAEMAATLDRVPLDDAELVMAPVFSPEGGNDDG